MFNWLFKKKPEGNAGETGEAEAPAPFEAAPPPPPPVKEAPAPKRPAPKEAPAPPGGDIPVAPPSSDDWERLLAGTGDRVTGELPAAPPLTAPSRPSAAAAAPPAAPPGRGADSGRMSPLPKLTDGPPPDLLVVGVQLRALPEKMPGTPRGWNVKVQKVDAEGIHLVRLPSEEEPLPVAAKEVLTLVIFDEHRQVTYECPILKVKAGKPETVIVGRPLKSSQEKSKLDSLGGRQHFRIVTQLPIEVKLTGAAAKGAAPIAGHTRDVSRGGLALLMPRAFETGRELEVRVLSWSFPLQVKAKVVRCEEEKDGRFAVAVTFPEDLGAITRDLIGHFIMENQRGR